MESWYAHAHVYPIGQVQAMVLIQMSMYKLHVTCTNHASNAHTCTCTCTYLDVIIKKVWLQIIDTEFKSSQPLANQCL